MRFGCELSDQPVILVLWLKTILMLCIIERYFLWVASHNNCAMLRPTVCVFWSCYLRSRAAPSHRRQCALQAELCVFVMYEINIDFSLPLKTMKPNKKEKSGLFCRHWVSGKTGFSYPFGLYSLFVHGFSRWAVYTSMTSLLRIKCPLQLGFMA